MCVAFFTLEHPDYALILCSNRDEYLTRPTEFAHFHSFEAQGHLHGGISQDQQLARQHPTQHPQDRDAVVLSGIDVQAGGTWLGLARTGKLALLTNITEDTTLKFPLSRGHLVTSFLTTPPSFLTDKHPDPTEVEQYLRGLVGPSDSEDGGGVIYAGFNLLLLIPRVTQSSTMPSPRDADSDHPAEMHATLTDTPTKSVLTYDAYLATNHGAGGEISCRLLSHAEREYGGMSNGSDGYGGKDWAKVKKGLEILRTVLNVAEESNMDRVHDREGGERNVRYGKAPDHSEDKIIEELFELLTWKPPTPPTSRAELCNTIQVDPILLRVSSSNIGAGAATSIGGAKKTGAACTADIAEHTFATSSSTNGKNEPTEQQQPPQRLFATRLATVILVKRTGEVVFVERDRWVLPDEVESNAERKRLQEGGGGGGEWSGDNRSRQGEERKPVLASTSSQLATQRVYRFKLDV
ncbi:hypothetical protein BKA83DRAFT_4343943 [Pisolithus microcarpus]|nr:hypothetical protein BKA83DRAFT_4343943 [Pisolithus microcarpus]